jgi:hypothetical protein
MASINQTKGTHMTALAANATDRQTFLRRVLFVDAATCVATGALMSLDAGPLSGLLGLPAALLFWSGLSLFPIAAFMLWVATRRSIPAPGAWMVIAGNAGWVIASIGVLLAFSPTGLGYAFVIAQAAAVTLLAELEYTGLKRLGV